MQCAYCPTLLTYQRQQCQQRLQHLEWPCPPTLPLSLALSSFLQAQGQPFEVDVLSGSEDPASSVPAVTLTDADGWTFCLVEVAEEEGGKGGSGTGRMAMEE